MDSDGRIRTELERAITAYLRVKRINQTDAAKTLGISQSQVSKIACCDKGVHLGRLFRLWRRMGGRVTLTLSPPPLTHSELFAYHATTEASREPESGGSAS